MQRAGTNPKKIKVDDKDDQEVFVTTVMQGTAPTGSRISDCQGVTVNYIGMQLCTATVLPYAWSNLERNKDNDSTRPRSQISLFVP